MEFGLPDPTPSAPVRLQSACHRTIIPAGDQPQTLYFLIEVLPSPELARLPINLVCVFDRSGPVLEECLPGLKQALRDLIARLRPDDSFALVTFNGQVIIPAQLVQSPSHLKRSIDQLTAGDEAHSAAGLAEGLRQAQTFSGAERVNRLVLLLGNETESDPHQFFDLADQAAAQNTPVCAVGVGSAWSETLLVEIADRSVAAPPGSHVGQVEHIPTPEDTLLLARYVFSALPIVSRQMSINLLITRGLQVQHIWQALPRIYELADLPLKTSLIRLPQTQLGLEGMAFLVEAQSGPRATGLARVLKTDLAYTLPGAEPVRLEQDLVVTFSPDTVGTNPLNTHVMDYIEAVQVYDLNLAALEDLRRGNRKSAIQKLRQSSAILASQGRTNLADRIRGEADYNIRQYGQVSNEGSKLILLAGQHAAFPV